MIPGIVAQVGAGASAAPTERWWRVRFPSIRSGSGNMTDSNPYVDIRYVAMAETGGGPNLVPSNLGMKASVGTLSNAVNDNTSLWNNWGIGPLAGDMWGAFLLPTAADINEVKIRVHSGSSNYSPFIVIVESSYDGVNWDFEWGQARLSWGSAEIKTFNRPPIDWATHAARDWLVQPVLTPGYANFAAYELEMASVAGGADLCTGGTPRSEGNPTYPASNLTDNNTGSLCGSTSLARYSYFGYSFASDQNINELRIWNHPNEGLVKGFLCVGYGGTQGTYSHPAWMIKQEVDGAKYPFTSPTYYDMRQPKPKDTAAHRYWRVRAGRKGTLGNGQVYSCALLDFKAAGVRLNTGGTAIASTTNSASWLPAYAFDGDPNNNNGWASDGNWQTFQWLGYDFGTPVKPDEVVLQARNDATAWNQTFSIITVEYSDDGERWYEKETFEVTAIAGALQSQSFALAA